MSVWECKPLLFHLPFCLLQCFVGVSLSLNDWLVAQNPGSFPSIIHKEIGPVKEFNGKTGLNDLMQPCNQPHLLVPQNIGALCTFPGPQKEHVETTSKTDKA